MSRMDMMNGKVKDVSSDVYALSAISPSRFSFRLRLFHCFSFLSTRLNAFPFWKVLLIPCIVHEVFAHAFNQYIYSRVNFSIKSPRTKKAKSQLMIKVTDETTRRTPLAEGFCQLIALLSCNKCMYPNITL